MKTNLVRAIVVMGISVMVYALKIIPNELMLSTLFTVASIFLSIGLSLIITFNLTIIENDTFYNKIKKSIDSVRKMFLVYFMIMTFAYLTGMHFLKTEDYWMVQIENYITLSINISHVVISIMFSLLLFGVCSFIMNFMDLQKLKNDIDVRLRQKNG